MIIKNVLFEACRDSSHPYHQHSCNKRCPDYPECSRGEYVEEETEIEQILKLFSKLQPFEQKKTIDVLLNEFCHVMFECTYCGAKVIRPSWLANLPLCRHCYLWIKRGGQNGLQEL